MTSQQPIRGGRAYDDPGVMSGYLDHRHSPTHSPNVVMEEPAFLSELGDVEHLRILDLGCGDAALADHAVACGARSYVGVDGSTEMVRVAARRSEHPHVSVIHADIEDFGADPSSFDVVVSRMVLHHIDDLDSVVRGATHALRPNGRLIFTVVHPVITSSNAESEEPRTDCTVDRYFERGARRREWFGSSVTWFHRTIEDYVLAVRRCGLDLVSLRECEPDPGLLEDRPTELERRRRVPLVLLVHAARPTARIE